jgi:hypothetical protein
MSLFIARLNYMLGYFAAIAVCLFNRCTGGGLNFCFWLGVFVLFAGLPAIGEKNNQKYQEARTSSSIVSRVVSPRSSTVGKRDENFIRHSIGQNEEKSDVNSDYFDAWKIVPFLLVLQVSV